MTDSGASELDRAWPAATRANRYRYAWLATAMTAVYLILIWMTVRRLLWYDELFTYYIAKQRTIHQLFLAIVNWDQNPPTLYLLSRFSMAVFGDTALAVRLPSIVEFFIGSAALIIYAGRKVGVAYAAVPLLLLFYNPNFFIYATEARPYALLAMFFSILLLCWDVATSSTEHRTLALWGMALANIGMFASHVFAVLSLGPFLLAELIRFIQRRKPDYPVWIALLLPIIGVFAYRSLFQIYSTTVFPPGLQARPRKLVAFFWHTLRPIAPGLGVAAVAAWVISKKRRATGQARGIRIVDLVVLAALIGNTVVLTIVLMLGHRAFWDRYCFTSVLAVYLAIGFWLARWLRSNVYAGWVLTATLAAFVLIQRVAVPVFTQPRPPRNSAVLTKLRPDLPLVPASGVTFLEMNHNDIPEIVSRVHYLVDTRAAVQYANATIFDRFDKLKDFFPMRARVEHYSDFVRAHREFLVVGATWWPEDWLLKKLAADHATITKLGDYPIPYLETTLFHVTMPADRQHEPPVSSREHTKATSPS